MGWSPEVVGQTAIDLPDHEPHGAWDHLANSTVVLDNVVDPMEGVEMAKSWSNSLRSVRGGRFSLKGRTLSFLRVFKFNQIIQQTNKTRNELGNLNAVCEEHNPHRFKHVPLLWVHMRTQNSS